MVYKKTYKYAVVLALILSTIMVCANGCVFRDSNSSDENSSAVIDINSSSSIFNDIEKYDFNIVDTEEMAIQYADLILENTLKKDKSAYDNISVSFDEKREFWIVNYAISDEIMGDDLNIVISKKTGEILTITFGE